MRESNENNMESSLTIAAYICLENETVAATTVEAAAEALVKQKRNK